MKYLALDIGNVICNVNFEFFIKRLSKVLNISLEDANYFLHKTQALQDIGITTMSDDLRNHFNIKSSEIINDLINEWEFTVSQEYIISKQLKDIIKEGDTKIALLSNIGREHSLIIKNIIGWDLYDSLIKFFSCDIGVRKPSYIYYKTFLDMYPEFKGCLYVDDRIENLDTATKFGFDAKHFAIDAPEGGGLLKIIKTVDI